MNTHLALKRLGRIEYTVARTSLGLLDDRVVQRFLAEDSVVRQSFDRALDYLDEAAAKWLHEPEAANSGDWSTPADTATSDLRTPPDSRPDAADAHDAEDAPVAEPEPDEEEQIEELSHELLEEQQTETFSGELAEDEELRRVQAELNAKRLIEEQDSAQRKLPE